MASRIADYAAGRASGPGRSGRKLIVVLVPFCARIRIATSPVREGLRPVAVRVTVQVGLCERTDRGEREALRLIEEHPGIAV
jgi:hypothetical protein